MSDSDPTGAYDPDRARSPHPGPATPMPERIGRYRIDKVLGEGGFGRVFLAQDEQLERLVALKVPHTHLIRFGDDAEEYLAEARVVASLDHPHIVPVYDVGATREFPCFIVSKFIEGCTLAEKIRADRPSIQRSAEIVATIAEALHYAHQKGLVHRDIKPGNVLLDAQGKPFVVDFGLALKEADVGTGPRHAGTGPYMSPEQARGEGHRVDGRSDIFSLGIVLYELLTGRRPFKAESRDEPPEQSTDYEPRPPRQVDDRIPKELERICFKALAKRATERYSTARDLAEDLRHFLGQEGNSQLATIAGTTTAPSAPAPPSAARSATSATSQQTSAASQASLTGGPPLRIVPKGLRSFDEHDANFYVELLPGPRDRDGLPDSIRFWKSHIETFDADKTFAVGLLYGPSGCGKSSQMKAGLLPRLPESVLVVYVEATAGDTEARMLHGLRKRCPSLPADTDLPRTLAALRRGQGLAPGRKVLIVLDQFEQWLHARGTESDKDLVQALRQCDGGRVQTILMVRDDFWMGVTRHLRDLEVPLVEGKNSAAVDLFPVRHAEKVLAAYGHAFGVLPEDARGFSKEQRQFLQQAVQGLAEDGKVVCVRLALFAQMMKDRPWTPAALQEVGGAHGIGATFLEETFSAQTAPPLHRVHQTAARNVLQALLPDAGGDIKGRMRSSIELLEASGYAGRPADFAELIRLLDGELRLITPAEAEGERGRQGEGEHSAQQYQLTHDFLVPSLRDWLTHKQKETRRGRAELLLADRAATWAARPETRLLPSLVNWANIHLWTRRNTWTEPQRAMMRKADGYFLIRGVMLLLVLILVAWCVYEGNGRLQARTLRDRLLDAPIGETPRIIEEMAPFRRWVDPLLQEARHSAEADKNNVRLLPIRLALLPRDPAQVDPLYEQALSADLTALLVIREALLPHRDRVKENLADGVDGPGHAPGRRFRAACVLARLDPINPVWATAAPNVAAELASKDAYEIAAWSAALDPVAGRLLPFLAKFLEDERRPLAERGVIARVYGNYAIRSGGIERLEKRLADSPDAKAGEQAALELLKKQASCAVALLVIGKGDKVWPLFKHTADPTLRCMILERIAASGVPPRVLHDRIERESDASIQRVLLTVLADYEIGRLPDSERSVLLPTIHRLYADHADAGVHSAAEALLKQWQARRLELGAEAAAFDARRNWFVNSQSITMSILDAPGDVWLREGDQRHKKRVARSFAISTCEVTCDQYHRFHPERKHDEKLAHTTSCPMSGVSWFEAAMFCNWLSKQDKIPPEEWCYLANKEGKFTDGMTLAADWHKKIGYRLPTEAEWVHACRAGADTTFAFGRSVELVGPYVWNAGNSGGRSQPVASRKPNDFGLFDMHGNVWEWLQDQIDPKQKTVFNRNDAVDDFAMRREVSSDDYRLQLGGSWGNQSPDIRPTFVSFNKAYQRHPAVGFRVAKTIRANP